MEWQDKMKTKTDAPMIVLIVILMVPWTAIAITWARGAMNVILP